MDFATYMKILFPIALVMSIVMVAVKHVREYRRIRDKNPGMTAGQAFEQHMDDVCEQAAEDRKEWKKEWNEWLERWIEETREKNQLLAEEVEDELRKKDIESLYEEDGKVYYGGKGDTRYCYDIGSHELKRIK